MTRTTNNQNGEGAAKAASLPQLAKQIRELNERDDRSQLAHALEVGALLIEAKAKVARGEWEGWVRDKLGMPRQRSARCMRLASNVSAVIHCKTVVEADELLRKPSGKPKAVKKPKAGKRLHGLHAKKRENDTDLIQTRIRIQRLVQVLEAADLPEQGVGNADDETLADIHQELTIASGWVDASLAVIVNHMGEQTIRERIRKLREDTNGRTPHEADTAARLADRLERKLGLALTA